MTSGLNDPRLRVALSATWSLIVLETVMLAALLTRTPPHPPLDIPLFSMAPFLAASLALGAATVPLLSGGLRSGHLLALLFAGTAAISYGPQKLADPAFGSIWPAVVVAELAIAILVVVSGRALWRFRS